MEQKEQFNNNNIIESNEDKSFYWRKSKALVVIPLFIVFFLFLLGIFTSWIYQSDTVKMHIPGKMTLEFTYPLRVFIDEKRESTIHFKLLDKTLNLKPTVILLTEENTHIIHTSDKDGKLSNKITLNPSEPGMAINVRITERKWARRFCNFQLEVQTGNMSGVQYSEIHSINVFPWRFPKHLTILTTVFLTMIAAIVAILNLWFNYFQSGKEKEVEPSE